MNKRKKESPGPEPEVVKLPHKDWEDAVREALKKKRPAEGWPEEGEGEKHSDQEEEQA